MKALGHMRRGRIHDCWQKATMQTLPAYFACVLRVAKDVYSNCDEIGPRGGGGCNRSWLPALLYLRLVFSREGFQTALSDSLTLCLTVSTSCVHGMVSSSRLLKALLV